MVFENREEAGKLLAQKLAAYKNNKDVIVYALPRGGVIIGEEIARYLQSPLDLIITRKIGHPFDPEYAIAAIAENGKLLLEEADTAGVDKKWLGNEIKKQRIEIRRRKRDYLAGRSLISPKGKIAILVDDGIATGLTIKVGAMELRRFKPRKIIIAVPVAPKSTIYELLNIVDEVVVLDSPSFLGAIGNYYKDFSQVSDGQVKEIMERENS